MKKLFVRTVTGMVYVAVIVLAMTLHPYAYLTLFMLVVGLSLHEFHTLNALVRLAVVVAHLMQGHAITERESPAHLGNDAIGNLYARKGHAQGITLRECTQNDEHDLAATREVLAVMREVRAGSLRSRGDGKRKF